MTEPRANRYGQNANEDIRRRAHNMLARGFLDNTGSVTLGAGTTAVTHQDCHAASCVLLSPTNAAAAALAPHITPANGSFTINGGAGGETFNYAVFS